MMPKVKINSQKQQAKNAELETIIESFGNAMRNAYKPYIANYKNYCPHSSVPFTANMGAIWTQYIDWCINNG